MSNLKPIGTEFDVESPPDMHSTDSRGTIIRYRVVEYVDCLHEGRTVKAEKLEPIKVTRTPAPSIIRY